MLLFLLLGRNIESNIGCQEKITIINTYTTCVITGGDSDHGCDQSAKNEYQRNLHQGRIQEACRKNDNVAGESKRTGGIHR